MHYFRKSSFKIAAFLVLLLAAVLIYPLSCLIQRIGDDIHKSSFASVDALVSLEVAYQGGHTTIVPFEDAEGVWYYFLPSFAAPSTTSIVTQSDAIPSTLNSITIQNHISLEDLHIDPASENRKTYQLVIGEEEPKDVVFLQSKNLPSLFLRSKSGTLDVVEEEKEIHEGLLVDAIDADGNAITGMKPEYIKGHGNTSYQRDKKPYQIKFTNAVSFFDMGAQEKWILLANRLDPSYMRNYMTYEMAKAVDLDAPDAEFVDLYINGEYRGNYLLAQKPEVAAAEYLLEHNYGVKLKRREYYLVTSRGEGFVVRWPDIIPDNRMEYIRDTIQQTEDEIVSGTSENLHFDMEEFAKKYLIEEFALNEAQSTTSAWYYINNRKMYVASVWDYDKAYGSHTRFQDPTMITRQACYLEKGRAEWFRYLSGQDVFNDIVWDTYREKMLPAIVKAVSEQIPETKERIRSSIRMDRLRWPANEECKYDYPSEIADLIGTTGEEEIFERSVTQLTDWITKRCQFYNENEEKIRGSLLLRFMNSEGDIVKRDAVMPETVYTDLPDQEDEDGNHVKAWQDTETGKEYPANGSITVSDDMMLMPVYKE